MVKVSGMGSRLEFFAWGPYGRLETRIEEPANDQHGASIGAGCLRPGRGMTLLVPSSDCFTVTEHRIQQAAPWPEPVEAES